MRKPSAWCLVVLVVSYTAAANAAVEGFVETFNGDGDYVGIINEIEGLDNPDWYVNGDGVLADGAYVIKNEGPIVFDIERDWLFRPVIGRGSFRERVEIKSPYLGDIDDHNFPTGSKGRIIFRHQFDLRNNEEDNAASICLTESANSSDGMWLLGAYAKGLDDNILADVPQGPHIALELIFDDVMSEVTFTYDNNINDETPALSFGPLLYQGTFQDTHQSYLSVAAVSGGTADGLLDHWSLTPFSDLPGDFDGDGTLDAQDIDLLSAEIRDGGKDTAFDLNGDLVVDQLDRTMWVHDLKGTYFGDANLNGEFGTSDLVNVFVAGEYEDAIPLNSTWATGDWDGDGDFNSSDIVMAFQDGGYELGPRTPGRAVPEPTSWLLVIAGAIGMVIHRCRSARLML